MGSRELVGHGLAQLAHFEGAFPQSPREGHIAGSKGKYPLKVCEVCEQHASFVASWAHAAPTQGTAAALSDRLVGAALGAHSGGELSRTDWPGWFAPAEVGVAKPFARAPQVRAEVTRLLEEVG